MKLVVTEFISLDGVIEGPGGEKEYKHSGWTIPYRNDEIGRFKLDELFACVAFLLGRVTYQGLAATWPLRTDEMGFAERMNTLPKYVVSTT
jgi:dihydrofolate reductase